RQAPSAVMALHPGTGPWADRPEVAMLGQELGWNVISPAARVLGLFSNRLNFLYEAERLGIPHLVMSFEPIHSLREIQRLVRDLSENRESSPSARAGEFPLVLKSVRGASGAIGIKAIHRMDDLEWELPLWLEQ